MSGNKTRPCGRQKGTPNKRTTELAQKAEELNIDPFEVILLYAKRDWKALGFTSPTVTKASKNGTYEVDTISAEMQLSAASEAAQYLYPKRKATEISGDPENPIGVNVGFSSEVSGILSEFKDLIGKVHKS